MEGNIFNLIKSTNKRSTANSIFNGKRLNAFPLRSGIRQRCPFSPFLVNKVLEVLAYNKTGKRVKDIQIKKEKNYPNLQMTWLTMKKIPRNLQKKKKLELITYYIGFI